MNLNLKIIEEIIHFLDIKYKTTDIRITLVINIIKNNILNLNVNNTKIF